MTGEGVSPDGTTSARYAFRHALYQQVLDQNLRPSQRRRLHQKIGEQLEASHAGRTEDVASALAAHFERSGDVERAVRYHGEAAAQARWRFSYSARGLPGTAPWRPETPTAISSPRPCNRLIEAAAEIGVVALGSGRARVARVLADAAAAGGRLPSIPCRCTSPPSHSSSRSSDDSSIGAAGTTGR